VNAVRTAFLLVLLLAPSLLIAQDSNLDQSGSLVLPASGATPDAFVPEGWRIEQMVEGDLNKDQRTDLVLNLINDVPAVEGTVVPSEASRGLVVLFRAENGALHRAAVSTSVLLCSGCGFGEERPQIEIRKGVMIVQQPATREATNYLRRFRWDPKQRTMVMIGTDVTYNRYGYDEWTSTNLLTGVERFELSHYDQERGRTEIVERRERRVPARTVSIEMVDSRYEE